MKMIDLTQTMAAEMPVFPGTPQPVIAPACVMERDGFRETSLALWSHTGTHIDAPAHILADGKYLDELPAESFFGLAAIVDISAYAGGSVPPEALRQEEARLKYAQFAVLKSGWERYWGEEAYYHGFPVLAPEAAAYLAALPGLRGVAVDMLSVDPVADESFAIHRLLLGAGKLIVENLCHLDALTGDVFLLSVLPLKYGRADGSPVRAVGFEAPAGIYYPK